MFPEILRSAQKDEAVMTKMTNEFSTEFMLKILGPRQWLQSKQIIEACCHFLYFSFTTLSDIQTLGEEYTGILPVTRVQNRLELASKSKRLCMIFMQTFGPVTLKYFVSKLDFALKPAAEEFLGKKKKKNFTLTKNLR